MTRLTLVPVLALATLSLGTTSHAQQRGWMNPGATYAAPDRQSYADSRRAAYDNGFREGLRLGERDGRSGRASGYQNERVYRRGDRGYHRSYGDRERYRQAFRTGYAAGYQQAYQRVGPRYNSRNGRRGAGAYPDRGYGRPAYLSPAVQIGFDDGYQKGLEDARKRRTFDILRHKWYREGDRKYDRRHGPREQYKDAYREGFKRGYARAFRW